MRKALLTDWDQLNKLFEMNSLSKGGYLCESSKPNKYNLDNIFVIADGNNLIAYLSYCEGPHPDILDTEMLQPVNFKQKFIYIKQVVVKRELQKAGIGTYLYKQFFNQYPGYIFYSHVSAFDWASIALHRKTGFFKVGVYKKGPYQSEFFRRLPQEDLYSSKLGRAMLDSSISRTLYGVQSKEYIIDPEVERMI